MAKRRASKSPGKTPFKKSKALEESDSEDEHLFDDGKKETQEEADPQESNKPEMPTETQSVVASLPSKTKGGKELDDQLSSVSFKSFSSPLKKNSANPYYVRFVFIANRLVAFYLSRARYGTNKTYANHLIRMAILRDKPWVLRLNISEDEFFLHEEGRMVPHFPGSKYNKRLFLLDGAYNFSTQEEFAKFARPVANLIATKLNVKLNIDSKVSVPPKDNELTLVCEDQVFSDFAGTSACCEKVASIVGDDHDPADFESVSDIVYAFFKPGSIPRALGPIIGCNESDMEEKAIYN